MFTREYHAYVTVYREDSEGEQFSEHSFVMECRSWRKPEASELKKEAQDHAISLSGHQDSVGGVIVKSLTRIR